MLLSRVLVASILVVGSSCVTSQELLGGRPHHLNAEEWNGTWLKGDGATVVVRVLNEMNGMLECSLIDTDKSPSSLEVLEIQLLEHGDWIFANVYDPESRGYYWARVWRDQGQVIMWIPNEAVIREMVKQGVLPGVLNEPTGLRLQALTKEQMTALTKSDYGIAVKWDEPVAFVRIGGN